MRRRSHKSNSGPGVVRALALFAILCGGIAFAASLTSDGDASALAAAAEAEAATAAATAAATESDARERRSITSAMDHLDRAGYALEATDYGRTRFHLHESKQALATTLE
jgi:hypothetical protein